MVLGQTFSKDSTIGANVTSCASVEGWTCSSQLQSVGPNAQSKSVDGAALPGYAIVLVGLLVVAVLSVGEFRLELISSVTVSLVGVCASPGKGSLLVGCSLMLLCYRASLDFVFYLL